MEYAKGIPKEENPLASGRGNFPGDASYTYLAQGSRLIVRSTPDVIKRMDAFVQRIDQMQRHGIPAPPRCDSGIWR